MAGSKSGKSCKTESPLERIPTNPDDFDEPDWDAIIEIAFPPWEKLTDCPRLDALGGSPVGGLASPASEDGKWNPCYYTKAFAGLDPKKGGYPTPIDTHYPYEFAAPFLGQPGDGSTHHCETDSESITDIAKCPKLGNTCGKDCAAITDEYGIGHIPPFVPLAAVKEAYGKCETGDICKDWFHFPTNGCNIKKSVLDELVYEKFGEGETIKFQPPILIDGAPSSTYFKLEYGGELPACGDGNCKGPHYCSTKVAGAKVIWGDFCPYVHTGENSGKYRHPHIALAALELWIANQCMPEKCAPEWLDSPNGENYGKDPLTATSITWAVMENESDPMSQPEVPYAWPNASKGKFPGIDTLYPPGKKEKAAPGAYVNAVVAATD